jgi:hypothetical protein
MVKLVQLHVDTRFIIQVDAIQTLMCTEEWNRISVNREVQHHVNAGLPRTSRTPANEDAIIAAVE